MNLREAMHDDLDGFFNPEDFGERTRIDGRTVMGIWENISIEGGEQDGPWCRVKSADLPESTGYGTKIVREETGDVYEIQGAQPDGIGVTLLILLGEDEC